MIVTMKTLEAALVEAQDQIKDVKVDVDKYRYAAQKAEERLFELQTKAWILEARLAERDETEKT